MQHRPHEVPAMIWPDVPPLHRRNEPERPLPILNHQTLRRLAGDMPGTDADARFAATYTRMLPARIERINQAPDNRDPDQAIDTMPS
ncbi:MULTISPECIES: hypothetical protein [Arthrobacter]|uniref:Uncharacterized protein n=1 Tax=Arthrobacter terricola TaxID=2547396 RepID=A0A4R5JZU4_9MICC|nr:MULTISPECIES: hypothetical protein [Arthrobacter]MBT8162431.1 hypothetical protein [Arthrobacter sp. GN70]TDF82214.1 hypothetical protein E1809_26375 [Arthrobacter terricola]